MTNQHGVTLSILSLGSTIYEISVPTKTGKRNLVLNYAHSRDYLDNPFYVCMAIGRTAGRIANGRLMLDGQTIQLPTNEGSTTLHGGAQGFNTQIWQGEIVHATNEDVIKMYHEQASSDGFPGQMLVCVTYSLTKDDVVEIKFSANSNEKTVFNPTQHTYFNLGKTETIKQHWLKINSNQVLELDKQKIPTTKKLPVAQTSFDFQGSTKLGTAIAAMSDTNEKGLDDLFVVQPDESGIIAELADPETNISVAIESKRNGLVAFTANSFTEEHMNLIRTKGVGRPYAGIALEPETLTGLEKENDFSEIELQPNRPKSYTIKYHLHF